ncbi:HET-domain-containing protein, partial [Setomelanomma holmii]
AVFTPTRLLRISEQIGSYGIEFIEIGGRSHTPYLALSYVWSGPQLHMTTVESYKRSRKIEYLRLPLAIRDAIQVTFKVGFSHLWIDSLCIIQDDDQDKALEIAQMTEVYSNAVITIAAARTDSVQGGFLHHHSADSRRFFEVGSESQDRTLGRIDPIEHKFIGKRFLPTLPQRGCAVQERLLSKHILQYTEGQIIWECQCQ